jgi:hypothetical protein
MTSKGTCGITIFICALLLGCGGSASGPDAGTDAGAPDSGISDAGQGALTMSFSAGTNFTAGYGAVAEILSGCNISVVQSPDAGDPWFNNMTTASYSAQNSGFGAMASTNFSYTLSGNTLTFTATGSGSTTLADTGGNGDSKLTGVLTIRSAGMTSATLQTNCTGTVTGLGAAMVLSGDHGPYNSPNGDYCASGCGPGPNGPLCSNWMANGQSDGPTASVTIPGGNGIVTENLTMAIGAFAAGNCNMPAVSCTASGTFTITVTPNY